MAAPTSGRARSSVVVGALMVLALVLALASRSGDDEDEPTSEPASPAEAYRALPDGRAIADAVAEAEDASDLPEDLLPPLGFIERMGSLTAVEQSCVRDYGYTDAAVPCVFGDPATSRSILLWGDSRAAMWIPALSWVAQTHGYRLTIMTKLGCPPLLGVTPWLEAESRPYSECADYNDRVADEVGEPDIVVLTGAVRNFAAARDGVRRPLGEGRADNTWMPDPEADGIWQEGLQRSLRSLEDTGADVFVLGEAPYPTRDAGTCLAANPTAAEECAVPRKQGVYERHEAAVRRTTQGTGAEHVPVLPWTCGQDTCPAVVDGHVMFRDTFHLNREYVLWISRALGSALGLGD